MTDSNLWADFVRWVSTLIAYKDKSSRIRSAAEVVSTRGEARVAIFAAHGSVAIENIDAFESQWLRDRCAPADAHSVDVPPTGGRLPLPKPKEAAPGQMWALGPVRVVGEVKRHPNVGAIVYWEGPSTHYVDEKVLMDERSATPYIYPGIDTPPGGG